METMDMDAVTAGIGMLSLEQAAAQLPFNDQPNRRLLTQRLVARGSLKTVQLDSSVRIALDTLRAFMLDGARDAAQRQALQLPMETLSPLFAVADDGWFGPGALDFQLHYWRQAMLQTMQRWTPERILISAAGGISPTPDTLFVQPGDPLPTIRIRPGDAPSGFLKEAAAELRRLVATETPRTPFLNMGEYFLATALQKLARDQIMSAILSNLHQVGQQTASFQSTGAEAYDQEAAHAPALAAAFPQSNVGGLERLYQSREEYVRITTEAATALPKIAPLCNSMRIQGYNVLVRLDSAEIMTLAGTNVARLICLAF
jgi:hypothetical protein